MLCYFIFIDNKESNSTDTNTNNITEIPRSAEDDAFKIKYFDEKQIENRIITNILLDKPIYRPSEILYLTAFLFNGVSMMPYSKDKREDIQLQIIDATDIVMVDQRRSVDVKNSIMALQYQIPSHLKGGEYKIKIKYNRYKSSAVRKFQILNSNNKMNPKIRKQVEFLKTAYSAGEQCELKILCTDCSSNILITSIIAKVDDVVIYKLDVSALALSYDVDKNDDNIQSVSVRFKMPDIIDAGNGNIAVTYQQDSIIETLTKTIPIALNYLNIYAYPESNSYLIPGLDHQRVYFEGFNPKTNEPADYDGDIISFSDVGVDEQVISQATSDHEGRAVSDFFNVEQDKSYVFRLRSPASCTGQSISLETMNTADTDMELIKHRAVLSSTKNAYGFTDEIDIKVEANIVGAYKVKLFKRELLISTINIDVDDINKGYNTAFNMKDLAYNHIGILRMTVYINIGHDIAIAERLIFRHSNSFIQFEMDIEVVSDSDNIESIQVNKPSNNKNEIIASPSDGIQVSIYSYLVDSNDFNKKAISIKGNVFVSDDSLSSIIDNRLLPPRLPSLVLFESEVDHLEDANVYLPYASASDSNADTMKQANIYIDLLLGTQGWRKFAYKHVAETFETYSGDDLEKRERLFAVKQHKDIPQMIQHMPARKNMFKKGMNMMQELAMPVMERREAIYREDAVVDEAFVANVGFGADDDYEDDLDEEDDLDDEDIFNDEDMKVAAMGRMADLAVLLAPRRFNGISYERVYAKKQRKFSKKEFDDGIIRNDFESTVYVSRDIETKCHDNYCGQSFRFGLSDVVGIYKVFIDGYAFNADDKIIAFGSNILNIKTELPLEINVLLPSMLMAGDEPLVPVMIQAATKQEFIQVNIDFDNINSVALKNSKKKQDTVRDVTFLRTYMPLQSAQVNNKVNITLSATNNKYKDSIKKQVEVVIGGFPQTLSSGGLISKNEVKRQEFELPSDYVDNTLNIEIKGYVSPIGQLNEAIKALIKEPCGCFEQTSSTTYPLVMALKYMNTHRSNVDLSLIDKAKDMLRNGYKKLTSYESKGGGFEWFGGSPGHEALTAYGVLEFAAMNSEDADMNGLVDETMLKRTIDWLLHRKDNNGGYMRNERSLDSFGAAPIDTTNAYITWSLMRSGLFQKGDVRLDKEINALLELAKQTSDSYIIALGALTMFEVGSAKQGIEFVNRLIAMQDKKSGLVKQIENTITNSGGNARDIEATALASLAFMASTNDSYATNIRLGIEFLSSKCKNGAYSSTQATALSLEAIVEYDKLFSAQVKPGDFELYIDDNLVESIPFGAGNSLLMFNSDKINTYLLANNNDLKSSKHEISLKLKQENINESDESKLPYSIYICYNVANPKSDQKVSVDLQTKLLGLDSFGVIKEGDVVTLNVELTNLKSDANLPMVVAIIGIAGGVELRIEKLRELKQGNVISFYETSPNELILYFRCIEKGKKLIIPIELLALIPGEYASPASRAYLFYTSEYKSWSDGITIRIEPNKELLVDKDEIHYLFQ